MSQNPPIDSGTQSSKTSGLKPALAAALASLEVQLDQELTRYRRTRIGTRTPNQARVGNYISSQPQELIDRTLIVGKTQPSVAEIKTYTQPTSVSDEAPQEKPAPVTVKSEAVDNPEVSSNSESKEAQVPLPSLSSSSSIVPAVIKAPQEDHLTQVNGTTKQPDDYLESSEALLRSLADEQPRTSKPHNSSDSLLSPLGIGSMLLLLVASLTLGYVVFNPKSLPQLNLGKLFNSNSSPNVANAPEVGSNPQPQPQPEITSIPRYPNLAAKEFPEVKDPNDIVGLQPKSQPTPTAPSNPIVAQTPINPLLVEPLPQIQQPLPPLGSPIVPTVKPSPEPTTTLPQANAEITPAADGFYHIVTDNQGDRALAAARKVVPDAYLSPSKKFIYLASLKTKEEALQRLQQLQTKGIKARVQQP
ncbi:hypothetical protein I8751_28560 [Nostocaceae cyanobacterium CENA357]|uniref:SPOR domain-containing protein n=1 Tax=Atlanticothrix silvestris CENA357 TaxID=1725252 RepID=A0A8J7HJB8_9CYAN|nr:hypothetical protein [Atlanticothrix silvestris]MBH8556214.1 hypothetical protein [Atlanticothrix silvestris CENA357]